MKLEFRDNSVALAGGSLDVGYPVMDARDIDGLVVVLCNWMAFPQDGPARNLFAYDQDGKLLWRAGDIGWGTTDAWTGITSEDPLVAFNFACFSCTIDPASGKVLDQRFTK